MLRQQRGAAYAGATGWLASMALWITLYVVVLVGPLLILAVWDGMLLLRKRRERQRGRANAPSGTSNLAVHRTHRAAALEGHWIAIRAQFLIAPHQALEEAEEFLRTLTPEASGQPIPTPSVYDRSPASEMMRLQSEFERVLSKR